MKLNRKHIPYLAASIQTAQYSLAGYFLIGHLGWFFVGIMGGLVSLAMAYGASQFNDVPEKRRVSSFVALIAIMSLSPVLVGTATWLHLTIIPSLYWRGAVSFAWGVLPDMAVVLSGFAAGKGLFDAGKRPKKKKKAISKVASKGGKKPSQLPQVARKHITDNELLAYLQATPGASQQKVADHFGVTRQAIGPRVKKLYEVKQGDLRDATR